MVMSLILVFLSPKVHAESEVEVKKNESSYLDGQIRVGYIPDQSSELLVNRYRKLAKYLSQETGLGISLVPTQTYDQLVKMMSTKQVSLAKFGAYTFLKAELEADALPLVMRDTDLKFTTSFLINSALNITDINKSGGLRFAFGSISSTSGHLMARYFLQSKGIDAEAFYSSVEYSGAHDKTIFMIQEGAVDLGAVNSIVAATMFNEQKLDPEKVSILWVTPPYVDYVWAVHPDVPMGARDSLMEAFLNLSRTDPEHIILLKSLGAAYYLPASSDDFQVIRRIAKDLELLESGS